MALVAQCLHYRYNKLTTNTQKKTTCVTRLRRNNKNIPFTEATTLSAKAEVLKSISLPDEQFDFNFSQRNNGLLLNDNGLQNPKLPNVAEKLPVVKPFSTKSSRN